MGRQSRAGGVLKSSLGFSGKAGREASNWVMWARSASLQRLRFTIFLDFLIRITGSVPSLPENMLVLDIAGRKWSGALSIEQAWQGVGEGDEEREDINFHEGGVQGLCLHQR